MNIEISQSEAKTILSFLKQGTIAPVLPPTTVEQPQSAQDISNTPIAPVTPTATPAENNPIEAEIKTADETPVLTRRNTGITTNSGNIWINPADREWLSKSAAYKDVSWEDYCALIPSDTPKSIEQFFN